MRMSVNRGRFVAALHCCAFLFAPAALAAGTPPMLPPGASGSWWSKVQADIARSEYTVSVQRGAACAPTGHAGDVLQAPNRAHNFRTCFTADGVHVVPRTPGNEPAAAGLARRHDADASAPPRAPGSAPAWRWGLRLAAHGSGAALTATSPLAPSASGNRVEYAHGAVTEWYVNDASGLEQGFTLHRPPGDAAEPLTLRVAVLGDLTPVAAADGIEFLTTGGVRVVAFGKLVAHDATGRRLSADMRLADGALELTVDTAGARYPVTVDPLATSPAWTAEPDNSLSFFGQSVAGAGDVNNDGYDDLIVGAPWFDNGESTEGRAYVYHGSGAGPEASPAWTAESNQVSAWFGWSVAGAGDVNNDGYDDVIIGSLQYSNGESQEGSAFVYLGGASGLAATAVWAGESNQSGSRYGWSVAGAGDVNNDGYDDVIVGAPYYNISNEGRAFLYLGGESGPAASAAWNAESNQQNAWYGNSVAGAGDVNNDGYEDVIVGAPRYDNGETDEGRAYLYLGSASGLGFIPVWTAEPDRNNARLGWSVAGAGNVDGDAYADVIVGAPDWARAFVYRGGASGPSASADWTIESDQADSDFGWSVAGAGDVDNNGYDDVIVGAAEYDNGQLNEGRAFVYLGGATGLAASAAWASESDQEGALFGYSVAGAGDINNDGYADVIVGASEYDNGEVNEGRAYVFLGGAEMGPDSWTAEADQAGSAFGWSVGGAGDVNNDGYDDVIVGAPQFDNGQVDEGRAFLYLGAAAGPAATPAWTAESDQAGAFFGNAVAGAGDVDNDDHADVIVGAYRYSNGESAEGRAYVYLGIATGLAASAAWTAESDQATAFFAYSVGGAGDVNGDEYDEVIVGAPLYDGGESNEGRVYVYHGSAAGPAASPAWTVESNQANAQLGWSVAGAGDVNGDNYADVITGAWRYTNGESSEGGAFVYHGSAAGLLAGTAWMAESDQASGFMGFSVDGAGDINNDGYADVIVGGFGYDNDESGEGRAWVYLGAAGGLAASAAWTGEPDQAGAQFGYAVAGAGDVNNDGYGDVAVGARNYSNGQVEEGRVFVYPGGAAGPLSSPAWTFESDQAGAYSGYSLAGAGDVNNDGFADIIAGAPYYDNGQADEGRAFVYFGSATDPVDSDGDGLSDMLEAAGCTSPLDVDSDDDGLDDGSEDADLNGIVDAGETDPCDADTDNDEIQDGTESGVTAAIADPDGDGPLLGTDTGVFVADADPATTTDPLDADTDGDGLDDGVEDANRNGAIDAGESDPNDGDPAARLIPALGRWQLAILLLGLWSAAIAVRLLRR